MIQAIYISTKHKTPLIKLTHANCIAGLGIEGDRNFGKKKWPGQNITLIESEAIELFNREMGQDINWRSTRRNIVTTGVRLNELVGQFFMLGSIQCYGVELCEPCSLLGKYLENERISANQIIKAFQYSGGLRADIVTDGVIQVGDNLVVCD